MACCTLAEDIVVADDPERLIIPRNKPDLLGSMNLQELGLTDPTLLPLTIPKPVGLDPEGG